MARVESEMYCTPEELQIGSLRAQGEVDKSHYIEKASDEIDSYISKVYDTPISVNINSAGGRRVASLILNQICSELASGRLLVASASGAQATQVHAYGQWLIGRALGRVQQIVDGELELPEVPLADEVENGRPPRGPLVVNTGPFGGESQVNKYYDTFKPHGIAPRMWPSGWPGY